MNNIEQEWANQTAEWKQGFIDGYIATRDKVKKEFNIDLELLPKE